MMKKTNIACTCIILFVVAICVIMLWITSGYPQPQYFKNGYGTINQLDLYDADDTGRDSKTPVDELYTEYTLQVFEEISQMYGLEKSAPNIGYFHPHGTIFSQYSKNCIYIDFMNYSNIEDAKSAIAHELVHYLSDDNVLFGFDYALDDTYLFGHTFTEGVTNYFSTKYAPDSCYQYETHVASLIAICYGEEALANDFFSSDVTKLKSDFDNSLKKYYRNQRLDSITLTPFDIMTSMLNTYGQSHDDQIRINQMLAIDEMLLYYAKQKGCEITVKEEILKFATTNNLDYLTKLL